MSERPELSTKNQYYISKERYYELKHFCLQYKEWNKALNSISLIKASSMENKRRENVSKPVEDLYERRLIFEERIKLIEECAQQADKTIWMYIFVGVTEGKSYDILSSIYRVPCCKDEYYRVYRKFFYILDKRRT